MRQILNKVSMMKNNDNLSTFLFKQISAIENQYNTAGATKIDQDDFIVVVLDCAPEKYQSILTIKSSEIATAGVDGAKKTTLWISQAHELLGHCDEDTTRDMAKHLEWDIVRGKMPPCQACAMGKTKRMIFDLNLDYMEAFKPGERVFLDLSSSVTQKEKADRQW